MSFRVPSHHSHEHLDRRTVIAMEEFCQLMESPRFFQQQQQQQQRIHHHQPHLPFSNSSSCEPQPQLLFTNNFGSLAHYRSDPQPQLSFSEAYGSHAHHIREPRLHQESQFPLSDLFGHSHRLPEASYPQVQVQECNQLTDPVKRAEKHYSIGEESIDKDAGDFIRMRHNKFNLSK